METTTRMGSLRVPSGVLRDLTLPRLIIGSAIAMILYLPLETALISWLPVGVYWALRLLPDGIVVALCLAVVAVGDRGARTTPVRLLWLVAIVSVVVIGASAVRGIPFVDSVNAVRVLVRYLALGLIVWWAAADRPSIGPLVIRAVLIAGAVQVAIDGLEILIRATTGATVFFLDGTFGRYDRLGLFLMAIVIAAVAVDIGNGRARAVLAVICLGLIYLTTSRQAEVGLAGASLVIALLPGMPPPRRMLAAALAPVCLALVIGTPSHLPPPPPDTTSEVGNTLPSNPDLTPLPISGTKGSVQLTFDPTKNFRLWYNFQLAPWAAVTEPLLGFGPGQQRAVEPDPRLKAEVEASGIPWEWARIFSNDSNYASMIIQYGVIIPGLFLLFLAWAVITVGWSAFRRANEFTRFALATAVSVVIAAAFGPGFEIRTPSLFMWVSLFGAIAYIRSQNAAPAPVAPVAVRSAPA